MAFTQFEEFVAVVSDKVGLAPLINTLTEVDIEWPSESVAVRVRLWVPGISETERGEPFPRAP